MWEEGEGGREGVYRWRWKNSFSRFFIPLPPDRLDAENLAGLTHFYPEMTCESALEKGMGASCRVGKSLPLSWGKEKGKSSAPSNLAAPPLPTPTTPRPRTPSTSQT